MAGLMRRSAVPDNSARTLSLLLLRIPCEVTRTIPTANQPVGNCSSLRDNKTGHPTEATSGGSQAR